MNKSRLIGVLKSLSKWEMQRLEKYLASPYHNTRSDVVQLYKHIAFALRENVEAALDKKYTYEKLFPNQLFPNQVYHGVNMRLVMSALLQCTERFLAIEQYRQDDTAESIYLARTYRQRKLSKSFRQAIKTAYARQQKKTSYSTAEQFRRATLQEVNYQFLLEENRQERRDLQEWHDTLNRFFIAETLRQNCIMVMHDRLSTHKHNSLLLNDVLRLIERHPLLLDTPAIFLYYYGYLTLTDKQNSVYFQQLKSGIIQYGTGFPQEELREISLIAVNYCILQNNKKENTDFLSELLDLYRVGLSQDAFSENGFLSRWTYKNIVTAGLMLEKFEWVEGFIYEYESKLERKYRKDSFAYNLACLFYGKKQYDKAISQLQQVKFDDVFLNLNARNLLLKIYLELKEYEALDAHLNSFEIFIKRKKITNPHRANYLNVIKLSRKIIQLNPHDKIAKAELIKEIEVEKNPSTRAFLLEVLGSL